MFLSRLGLFATGILTPLLISFPVHAQTLELLTNPRARSMMIARIEVHELRPDGAVYIDIRGPDDEEFTQYAREYGAFTDREFTRADNDQYALVVPLIAFGAKTYESVRPVFNDSGMYTIRVRYYWMTRVDPPVKPRIVTATYEFAKASEADMKYFALAGEENVYSLLGLESDLARGLSGINEDILGLALISHIVHSTRRERNPGHGKSEWADPLYELAFAVPDSSYAPYLAYYAACSYMWQKKAGFIKRTYGYELPDKRIADLDYYKKARRSLEFAAERGDPYIKPFAMCFLACMKAWAADFAGADELIRRVSKEPNTPKQIPELVDQLEAYTEKLRSRVGK